jgi:hypothetical protein
VDGDDLEAFVNLLVAQAAAGRQVTRAQHATRTGRSG